MNLASSDVSDEYIQESELIEKQESSILKESAHKMKNLSSI